MSLTQRVKGLEAQAGIKDRRRVVIVSSQSKTEQELQAEIARLQALHHPEVLLIDDGDPGPFAQVGRKDTNDEPQAEA
jgi:hypothetical protein